MRNPITTSIASGVAGLVVGSVGGYLAAHFAYKSRTRKLVESEEHYKNQVEEFAREVEVAVAVAKMAQNDNIVADEGYLPEAAKPVGEILVDEAFVKTTRAGAEVVQNIFEHAVDTDFSEYRKTRDESSGNAFVIDFAEYTDDLEDFADVQLTYYEGDNVLCDAYDVPIELWERNTFPRECLKFGMGSGDANIVFIASPKNQAKYEVIRDAGLYAVEVLGGEVQTSYEKEDLKHADTPMKFRE